MTAEENPGISKNGDWGELIPIVKTENRLI